MTYGLTLLFPFLTYHNIRSGSSPTHCAGNNPIPPTQVPPTPVPAPTPIREDDSRLVAYLGNWQSCPTTAQVAAYTHIVIAFAVSYTWSPGKNNCSQTCQITEPPICNNSPNPSLVAEWQAAGKKVILSFGGAGMGGSWAGDNNDCWENCYGREEQVTNRLVQIVNNMSLDGIDLDFEYDVTPNAVIFLNKVTTGLKNALQSGSEVTHAPMDTDIIPGKPYYEDILKVTGKSLDFLMPQYYNGNTRPAIDGVGGTGSGSMSALTHYTTIVDNIFGGDPKRMIFGFCISDCAGTGSNANGLQASSVMTDLADTYPCNGGAFFWVAQHDTGGSWSSSVGSTINNLALTGCSSLPTKAPMPTSRPTSAPVTSIPTRQITTFAPAMVNPSPAPQTTPSPSTPPVPTNSSGDPCCAEGFTGWKAWNNCLQYYNCVNGNFGTLYDVPAGTFYDESVSNIVWASDMDVCVVASCGRRLRGGLKNK